MTTYQLTEGACVVKDGDTTIGTTLLPGYLPTPALQEYLDWLADGNTPTPYVPPPVDMQAAILQGMTDLFDATAQQRNYDNRLTCALRAGYPGPFHDEGSAFASWMDAQNAKAYALLAQVQAGTMPMPESVDAALALLDPMVWPT